MTAVATRTGARSDRMTVQRLQRRMVQGVPRGTIAFRKERWQGLSCLKGNLHEPFLGGWAGAIPLGYPAREETYSNATRLAPTQLPRSRSSPRLKPGVDMTSDVKSWEPLVFRLHQGFSFIYRTSRSQEKTTGAHAASRGLGTTCLASVGCRPHARDERTCRPRHATEGATTPGRRRGRERWQTSPAGVHPLPACGFWCSGHWLGHGPPAGTAGAGQGEYALVGMVAWGQALARPLTAPDLGLPPEGRGGQSQGVSGSRRGWNKQGRQEALVGARPRVSGLGERQGDQTVRDRQEAPRRLGQPMGGCCMLTLGPMPRLAGRLTGLEGPARWARRARPPKSRRPARAMACLAARGLGGRRSAQVAR